MVSTGFLVRVFPCFIGIVPSCPCSFLRRHHRARRVYTAYEEVVADYVTGTLTVQDLKAAVAGRHTALSSSLFPPPSPSPDFCTRGSPQSGSAWCAAASPVLLRARDACLPAECVAWYPLRHPLREPLGPAPATISSRVACPRGLNGSRPDRGLLLPSSRPSPDPGCLSGRQ